MSGSSIASLIMKVSRLTFASSLNPNIAHGWPGTFISAEKSLITDVLTPLEIFVDVEGDKYLARIVRTFPPKSLTSRTKAFDLKPGASPNAMHPLAVDLNLENEVVDENDDPMSYFYNVRLITGDVDENNTAALEYASSSNGVNGPNGQMDVDEGEEKWQGSVMEVKADKLS